GLRTHMPCCVRHATGPINDRTPTTLGVWTLGVASRPRLTGKLTSAQEDTHLLERRFIKVGSAAWRGTSSGATLPFFCAIMAVKPGRRRSGRRRPERGRRTGGTEVDAMGDLFAAAAEEARRASAPLATRMRPRTLDEVLGQEHLIGPGRPLRVAIETDRLPSLILYGPPGSGKTTLAEVIARTTKAHFVKLNAVGSGVADVRQVIEQAKDALKFHGRRTVLFIDEIHRFNKAQQDALLPAVEDGTIILIGATTENPYFSVNAPLLSRTRILRLHALSDEQLAELVRRALADAERGLGRLNVQLQDAALAELLRA